MQWVDILGGSYSTPGAHVRPLQSRTQLGKWEDRNLEGVRFCSCSICDLIWTQLEDKRAVRGDDR